jgi:hypothetical protein
VRLGGLAFYGADRLEGFRRSAGYVDRIFRGEKPGDLPSQQPTKYELILNRVAVVWRAPQNENPARAAPQGSKGRGLGNPQENCFCCEGSA